MMTRSGTLRSWLEALGLEVTEAGGASREELTAASVHEGEPQLVVRQSDAATWRVVHERRVSESALSADWRAPWQDEAPAAAVDRAAQQVAYAFPLVEADTRGDGGDVVVRFGAPVFGEGLTRQAFALTVSAVLKAARGFDLVVARRADELAAWKEFEAASEQRRQEQEEMINRLAEAPAPSEAATPAAPVPPTPSAEDTLPAAGWSASHVVTRRAKAWAQPDPAGARAGELKRRVPVQVVERQGEWARVVTSNGWSGWIDSRDLKAR
jgi:Bacterial SH3 domain